MFFRRAAGVGSLRLSTALAGGTAACSHSTSSAAPKPAPLEQTRWVLAEVSGRQAGQGMDAQPVILQLDRSLMRATGYAGVNRRQLRTGRKLAPVRPARHHPPCGAPGGRGARGGHNRNESLQDPTAHAEILAITAAANTLGTWRLEGATLYVTLEPCLMCSGAIFLGRIARVVYAARDPKRGALGSVVDVSQNEALNHHTEVEPGPLGEESSLLLKSFFEKLRTDPGST